MRDGQLVANIIDKGMLNDAIHCIDVYDFEGLTMIINIAEDQGNKTQKLGRVLYIADLIKSIN